MSFVQIDDVLTVNEGFIKKLFKECRGIDIETPFLRMPYAEAMDRFGSDKPDMRFGMTIRDVTALAAECSFSVFLC